MSKRHDALIAEQPTYLDMVTAREPYRAVTASDRINARAELAALRSRVAELEHEQKQAAFDLQEYQLNIKLMQAHNIKQAAKIAELEAAQANNADSLRNWADLWAHITARLGEYEALPNSANFDAMLAAQSALTPRKCQHCNQLAPSKPVEEVEMCNCGNYAATPPHVCPYAEDINGDSETLCTCCDVCTAECAADI